MTKILTDPALLPIIFSDLDGTLLDHYTYNHAPANALLEELEQQQIPVILTTSKTLAEVVSLRESLKNRHPFIVENGAAVVVPNHYFDDDILPQGATRIDGQLAYNFSRPREHWQKLLQQVADDFTGEFFTFAQLGTSGIIKATGLSKAAASQANQRLFNEPVQWLGTPRRRDAFTERLQQLGAHVITGGRFLHIGGHCDKSRALNWLCALYQKAGPSRTVCSIAAGDSYNDVTMLEAADWALRVRSPAHQPPSLTRATRLITSQQTGPEGWVEGITEILRQLKQSEPSHSNPSYSAENHHG